MKRRLLMYMLLFLLAFSFSACSSDNTDSPVSNSESKIETSNTKRPK